MLEKLTIRSQILLSFTVLATSAILIIGSLSAANIGILGETTQELSEDTLIDQMERNILHLTEENSQIVERKIANAISAVQLLAIAAENLFSSDFELSDVPSYFDFDSSTWPGANFDPQYQSIITKEVSTYYFPQSHPDNVTSLTTSQMNEVINTSSHLDFTFKSIMQEFPEFAWLYVGFQESSLFRVFPGSVVSENREYDPQQRPWYVSAQANLGDIIITDPYVDAFGQGLMVTIAVTIHDSQSNLVGVVGGDLTLALIQDKILNVSFLDTGYASLMDTSGLVLVHPNFDPEIDNLSHISELERDMSGSSTTITSAMVVTMSNREIDLMRYDRDDQVYILAHALILEKYVFMMIVEEREALQGMSELEETIDTSSNNSRTLVTTLSILTLFAVLAIGLWISNQISRPITKLSQTAQKISSNITSRDIFEGVDWDDTGGEDDEISELTKSFSKMLDSLKSEKSKK